MKIVRSILALVVGAIVAVIVVGGIEMVGHVIYPPPGTLDMHNPEAMQKYMETAPTGALMGVMIAWVLGAFVGGGVAALIAACCRCTHAAIIGVIVLAMAVVTMMMFPHPDWMKIAGLLLPIPSALIAGKIVSKIVSSTAATPS